MVGTLQEALADMARKKGITDGLNPFQRDLVGRCVRLELHFTDPVALRMQAEILAGLADRIRHYSARGDLTDYAILMAMKGEAADARKRMLHVAGRVSKKGDVDIDGKPSN